MEQHVHTPEQIMQMSREFMNSRVLLTAYELDIFTTVGDDRSTSDQVAVQLGTNSRATDRLMNALVALGFLEKNNGWFSNNEVSRKFLMRGKPGYLGGLMHMVNLWDTWATLTEAVRRGSSVLEAGINDRGHEWLTAFIAAMHANARERAPEIVGMLDLSEVRKVLDVGGGSGAYSMAFARAHDGIRASIFDLPNVVPLTQGYVKAEGLESRVETTVGDYNRDELGMDFDLVFLSAIIHSNSPIQNLHLIEKCSRALRPGGQIIIQDFIIDECRTSPEWAALFSLNMLVGTAAGDTYTYAEVQKWLEDGGFVNVWQKDTGAGTTLIGARKG